MVDYFGPLASQLGVSVTFVVVVLVVIIVWEAIWKFTAMWRAAKNNSVAWFIVLGVINTVGILPILYLFVFSKTGKKRKR